MIGTTPHERAYIGPFFLFLAMLLLGDLLGKLDFLTPHWALTSAKYWIYPAQIAVCGFALFNWRSFFRFGPWRGMGWALGAGIASLVVWVAPQEWFGFAPRVSGFNPAFFGADGAPFWLNVTARFFRMVIVVPLVEELFWRGFLLRYLIREEFETVPFGQFAWKAFAIVSIAFCFEHSMADWAGALITSVLYNIVAFRTKSLGACVVAHGITNLGLGIYIMRTGQYGFW